MKKRIGCLHAHHSNIPYIEQVVTPMPVEWVHFVDPGLMHRLQDNQHADVTMAKNKVREQLEWIANTGVDVILITCTQYLALLEELRLQTAIPIIKLDEPFFHAVCQMEGPQVLVFTNPATVDGTMGRLRDYAHAHGKTMDQLEICVMENVFELIMRGPKARYDEAVSMCLKRLVDERPDRRVAVAQLSMVDAAEIVEREWSVKILHPLQTLAACLSGDGKQI